ncbi:vWA domain-containing protein [Trichlorobacter ammonificans]|uniref:Predicted metal-dependent peptidase n=1 Tax=Trichlorobacter ammonificans TaxID=2916410 RepID=A0ABM9D697_9BACT|nr:VWA-like domain-containing protein [Trichlorobacter ammonificans]CAH2030471.1 Predicted metal-dependent peptidase [Trichlorobacter ammonificans]
MRTLQNAIIRLLKQKPFYGHLLLHLRREPLAESGKSAALTIRDGLPVLAVAEDSFTVLSFTQQEALLEHLLKHLLHLHPLRRRGRNRHDWDVACDLAINPSIDGLPPGALLPEHYRMETGLSAEEYYDLIVPPFDMGNLEGSGFGSAERDTNGAAGAGRGENLHDAVTLDDHAPWQDADSTPLSLAEEMVRSMARDALRGSDGEMPADLREVVNGLLQPAPIPWRQVLRQFVAAAGRTGRCSTWMREHRRFSHQTPGIRKKRRLHLLVGVDVSDSTNIVELRDAFAAELLNLARGRECSITVLYANSRIQRIERLSGASFVAQRYDGGGFTDLRPVFDYAHTLHPRPAAVIYLTDGIGPVPEQMAFPTLWVLTKEGEKPAPWGVELRLTV